MTTTDESHAAYKHAKEAFVSQLQGGTIWQINAVSFTALTTYLLWAVLRNRSVTYAIDDGRASRRRRGHLRNQSDATKSSINRSLWQAWAAEVLVLVLPILLACTVMSNRVVLLNSILVAISAVVLLVRPPPSSKNGADIQTSPTANLNSKSGKTHWSKLSDDEEEEDEERERELQKREEQTAATEASKGAAISEAPPSLDRISVDSAAVAAHASAEPPTQYAAPGDVHNNLDSPHTPKTRNFVDALGISGGNGQATSSQHASFPAARKIVHRSSPSLARSAAPRQDSSKGRSRLDEGGRSLTSLVPRNQPFLTVYRSHMMLMTIICILAVDFPAFPREFAKCETWGTSLMDLGVGSFVFSLGIISALPMLRASPSERFKPLRLQLLRDFRRSLPLFILGGIRVIMVKGVDYPEHVSEYGVHWNFFITLAILPFFGTIFRPIARSVRFATAGLAISVVHQVLLSFSDMGTWAASNSVARSTLLAQNKEGLASLPGYVSIFFLGIDLGHYVLPRDPYLAYRRPTASRKREKTDKLAMVLSSYAAIWWGAYYLQQFAVRGQVSRRLANFPYVLWIAAYNTLFLLAYVTIYMVLLQPLDARALYAHATVNGKSPTHDDEDEEEEYASLAGTAKTPALLHALNAQAFAVFLVANLLTGLVNLSMQTMYTSDPAAVLVLTLYLSACLALSSFAYQKGWRLKL